MLDFVTPFKNITKIERLQIDNWVFRLHYKATCIILAIFALIVTSRQYIGDPIDCIVDEIPQNVMDTYCWIYSTFIIPEKLTGKVGQDVAHPGVGTYIQDDHEIKYQKYYQWVCFVLLFQAIMFHVPRYYWKTWENGRIKTLIVDLNEPVVNPETKKDRKQHLLMYFNDNIGSHNSYFYKFLACEVANFINVLGQIFFTDFFLDGLFLSYGSRLISYDPDVDEDPMAKVFPKVTKCTFHKYGPSGTVQKFDGLCVLPVNILNEKIYAIIWFWFIILAILSALVLVYRLMFLGSSTVKIMSMFLNDRDAKKDLIEISHMLDVGDWFVLCQLQKNMDKKIFKEILSELNDSLEAKPKMR